MTNCEVKYYWAVSRKESEIVWEWGKSYIVNWVTGSATVLEIWWKRILIDLWASQWSSWSDIFNKENIEFLNGLDWVYLTHTHIDHVWRLPLLIKYWFAWKIYMTTVSKLLSREMLFDSVKIQEWERNERLARNKDLWSRLREALKIKKYLLSSSCNDSSIKYLTNILWSNYDPNDVLEKIDEYLLCYQVAQENDIAHALEVIWEVLFTAEDVEKCMLQIETVDYDEEKILFSKKISSKNSNTDEQDLIDNLPLRIANGFDWEVSVSHCNKII